uniref:Uncharacterized protein n=1 Tax=Trichogramma kaykai TaxID=54128 RepID=A0ABD2VV26_9HYME
MSKTCSNRRCIDTSSMCTSRLRYTTDRRVNVTRDATYKPELNKTAALPPRWCSLFVRREIFCVSGFVREPK